MGVRLKSRRKLTIGSRQFCWYVCDDDDSNDHVLHVLSLDKKFIVTYHLNQPDRKRFIVVMGTEFAGAKTGGTWKRFTFPKWESGSIVSPKAVRALITWCLSDDKEVIEVDWQGDSVSRK